MNINCAELLELARISHAAINPCPIAHAHIMFLDVRYCVMMRGKAGHKQRSNVVDDDTTRARTRSGNTVIANGRPSVRRNINSNIHVDISNPISKVLGEIMSSAKP